MKKLSVLAATFALLITALPGQTDNGSTSVISTPDPQLATPAGQIYLQQARDFAQNQADRELLINVLARLLQVEARLNTAETNYRNASATLREGVQSAFTHIGEEFGRMQKDIAKLSAAQKQTATNPAGSQPVK